MRIARRLIAIISVLCLLPALAVVATSTASASGPPVADDALFEPLPGFSLGKVQDVRVRPTDFRAYRVDLDRLGARLRSGGTVSVTIPAGTPTTFHVVEHSVMAPALQAAHPEIRTYRGADADGSTITLDVTPMGFHAFVRRPDGVSWLVDPASNRRGEDRVLSYAGHSTRATQSFVEKELERAVDAVAPVAGDDGFSTPGGIVSKRTYRMAFLTDNTYASYFGTGNVFAEKSTMMARVNEVYNDDLAIEFLLITGTDTQLNFDTVAKMTGANGPCGASACFAATEVDDCDSDTLNRNVFVLGQVMGADNFDIGHIGLGNAGGGVAGLGVVGDVGKARGCTGLPTPDGDLYAIDYVAHEIGHQMGGNHTFDSSVCNGNRRANTSVEPGSGSSVMAYAGICGADNLQAHSDPYFSQRSLDEIEATTANAPASFNERQSVAFSGLDPTEQMSITCAACSTQTVTWTGSAATDTANLIVALNTVTGSLPTVTQYDGAGAVSATGFTASWTGSANIPALLVSPVTAGQFTALVGTIVDGGPETNGGAVSVSTNSSPTITGAADKTIPTRTPFALTAPAADVDGDTLTYVWEQNDRGGASGALLQSNTKTVGPLFRQFGIAAPVTADGTLEYNSPGENLAGTSSTRTFPDLTQILAGNTNAATGSCPVSPPVGQTVVDCFSEFLPTSDYLGASSSRQLNFRLSVRDEFTPDAGADDPGGLTRDDVVLTVDPATGPFLVTSRPSGGTAIGTENVTWNVAGTAGASLAPNVRITLSSDGGLTYPTELVASTPNDGAQVVTLPDASIPSARIKVEAVGNYFFDVNDADFSVVPLASNVAPTVNAGPDGTAIVGTAFTSAGSFLDESPGTATATVDYGDGSGTQPLPLTGSTFALSHTYATTGAKTVTVTVADNESLSGNDTATVTVNPAPPVASHLGDGKGKFVSKKGSSKAAKEATGPSRFSFTADTTGGRLSGSAKFKFKLGKVKFAGTMVTAASTSGRTLTMTVTGTNNGKAGYTLVIVAVDRSTDKIRVRLLKGSKVRYDSMPGKPVSAKPKTRLTSGSITVV